MSDLSYRQVQLQAVKTDKESMTISASLSSDSAVEMPHGREILVHTRDAVDLSRVPVPLYAQHQTDVLPIGKVENVHLSGGKLRGLLRFSKRAKEIWEDVQAGILSNLSIGYRVLETRAGDSAYGETWYVTRWELLEVSIVGTPADPSVGIGRSYSLKGKTMSNEAIDDVENKPLSRSARRAADQAAQDERMRIKRIEQFAEIAKEQHPSESFARAVDDVSKAIINNGQPEEVFSRWLEDNAPPNTRMALSHPANITAAHHLDMSRKEIEQFSFVRAIRAQIDPKFAQQSAGLEVEASRAIAQRLGREPQGMFVPVDVLQRDLNVGTATAGGHLVATELLASDFISMLRNKAKVIEAGARVIDGLMGNIAIPRQTSAATAYWVAEGTEPTESAPAFDQVSLSPETVGGYTDFTRKLILQSTPAIEMLVRQDLATVLALEIDRVAINGSGSGNEPPGILNTTGIGSVALGTDGAAPDWDAIVSLENEVLKDNVDDGPLAYLTNSSAMTKMKRTFIDAGSGVRLWDTRTPGTPLNGYAGHVSNQVPSNLTKGTGTNLSAILFGNWADLIIGQWGGLDLLTDPYTFSASGTVRVVALQDVDIAVRHPESFAAIVDAFTA